MVKEITNDEIKTRMDELFIRISELQNLIETSNDSVMIPLYEESLAYAVEMYDNYEIQLNARTGDRDMVRVNTRISAEVNDWLDARAKKTGVPKSAIIHIALEQYMQQLRSVDALELSQGTLSILFDKVSRIEERLSSEVVVKS